MSTRQNLTALLIILLAPLQIVVAQKVPDKVILDANSPKTMYERLAADVNMVDDTQESLYQQDSQEISFEKVFSYD